MSLLRCSRCCSARYCNAECQRADWQQHKRECPLIQPLQARCEDAVACAEVLTAGRCLWRRRGEPTGSPAAEEFDALAPGFGVDDGDEGLAQLALSLAGLVPPGTRARDLAALFAKFRCNSFGVQANTREMDLVGAACHPRAALLNHSCAPNCVLVYRGKAVEVRTLRDVAQGEELCHSYTNLCRTTSVRRQVLRDSYGFHCDCRRCVDDVLLDGGRYVDEVMRGVWDNHDASAVAAIDRVRKLAAEAGDINDSDGGDHEEAVECRRRKRALIFEALQLVRGVCLPGSMMRYPLESAALDDLLAIIQHQRGSRGRGGGGGGGDDDEAARECCTHVVAFQEMALSHVPFHPLLSSQRVTLAELQESCGDRRAAAATLRRCMHALRVTHGPGIDLYDQTASKLAELTEGLEGEEGDVVEEEEQEVGGDTNVVVVGGGGGAALLGRHAAAKSCLGD